MSLQIDPEVIDHLRGVAKYIAEGLSNIQLSTNRFDGVWYTRINLPSYQVTEDALVITFPNDVGDARIIFRNIAPDRISSMKIYPAVKTNERVLSVEIGSWENGSSEELKESSSWKEQHTRSENNSISDELTAGIQGKIAGSYAGFSAELQTNLQNKLSISHNTGEQTVDEKTISEEFVIGPWKSLTVTKKETISDFRQKVQVECTVETSIELDAGFNKSFKSLHEFQLYIKGGGGGSGNAPELDKFFTEHRANNFQLDSPSFTIERERDYTDTKTTSVERTEVDIER